jgi:hypothetical protein
MSKETIGAIEIVNYVFTAIFTVEAGFKLIAFGRRYFKEKWNIFDFLIVAASIIFVIVGYITGSSAQTTTQVVRTLRVGRILKLFRNLKQLQIIFTTFINSLSSLINVGSLMFLIIYIYAVIGISLFSDIKM